MEDVEEEEKCDFDLPSPPASPAPPSPAIMSRQMRRWFKREQRKQRYMAFMASIEFSCALDRFPPEYFKFYLDFLDRRRTPLFLQIDQQLSDPDRKWALDGLVFNCNERGHVLEIVQHAAPVWVPKNTPFPEDHPHMKFRLSHFSRPRRLTRNGDEHGAAIYVKLAYFHPLVTHQDGTRHSYSRHFWCLHRRVCRRRFPFPRGFAPPPSEASYSDEE